MATSELFDRARRAEDDYFRRKDAELVAKARAAALAGDESRAATVDEPRHLGDALDLHTPEVVTPLFDAGLRAGTIELLEWIPAVEVAWVDGADAAERDELSRRFAETTAANGTGVGLMNTWLVSRPAPDVFEAARQALRHQVNQLDADSRAGMLRRIASRCEIVARASGGWFGLGGLSTDERACIDRIREGLGDEAVPEHPLPGEIPH